MPWQLLVHSAPAYRTYLPPYGATYWVTYVPTYTTYLLIYLMYIRTLPTYTTYLLIYLMYMRTYVHTYRTSRTYMH